LTDTYQGFVDAGKLPGAVLLVARGDQVALLQAVGFRIARRRRRWRPMRFAARLDDQAHRLGRGDDPGRGRQARELVYAALTGQE
jgi:hypothetical protein